MGKRTQYGEPEDWKFGPDTTLQAWHDGDGWCIRSDRPGREPFYFGCYAETAKDAHWAAGQVAQSKGCKVLPLRMQ